jgi:hypothetical protein
VAAPDPGRAYRWYFGAHGVKNLERSVLGFSGIGPLARSLIGTEPTFTNKTAAPGFARPIDHT